MIYEETIKALKYETSKLLLNTMNDDRVVQIFEELIQLEIYFDEFLGVTDRSYYRPDFLKSIKEAMARLEISIPETRDEAVWSLLKHHISEMTDVNKDPLIELDRLMADVYWNYDFGPLTKKYLGDSHGVEQLIGLYWGVDDAYIRHAPGAPPKSEIESYKKMAREYARDWQVKYAS